MALPNRVDFDGQTLIDLTSDTVTPETLATGATAHDASGALITGAMRPGSQDLSQIIAEDFDETKNYEIGDYVIYSDCLYRFSASHTAGAWDDTHVIAVTVVEELDNKQNTLTFDTAPTANSSNPVTSGGVASALDEKVNKSGDTMTGSLNVHNGFNSYDLKLSKENKTVQSATVVRSGLDICGPAYGNTASELISNTAGTLSYGDGGPQIRFSTSTTPETGQSGALIFTDHDSVGTGVSFNFVSNQDDCYVNAKHFKGTLIGSASQNVLKSGDTMTGGLTVQTGGVWIQGGSNAGGNNTRMGLSSGVPDKFPYNASRRGVFLYSNAIAFADPYNGNSNNDAGWIRHIEETGNSGTLEIAVGDDGNESIVARQYNASSAVLRTVTLLDANGNSSFPGKITGTITQADNADKVDGYHASDLWRKDGATWNPNANVSLPASANNQEWSFDIAKNGHTGCYWHVWENSKGSLLKVSADDGAVYIYNVGTITGIAARPNYSISTTDLTPGTSNLTTNQLYFVYS